MPWVIDVETNGLLPEASKVHCIVAQDFNNGQTMSFKQDECLYLFPPWARSVDQFIMHNGVSFDAPVLNKLVGTKIKVSDVVDTLILSQLYNPIRPNGHSLAAWGERLGMPKGNHTEFHEFSGEMVRYCNQDVKITRKLMQELSQEGQGFSPKSVRLEHNIRAILDQQEETGFALDVPYTTALMGRLEDEADHIENNLQGIFEPIVHERVSEKTGKRLKDKVEIFNPSSRQQIASRLMELGWKPTQRTEKGNIIVDEKILSGIDLPEAKQISHYLLLQKRVSQIRSWLEACVDGRVHGTVMTLKTITSRMAHSSPNMAQIPASYSPYGTECRTCWTVSNPLTHCLVGTDASGLELRALAHYINDPDFTKEVIEGDIHSANQRMAGLPTRDLAKTFIYAFLYGAGASKIGKIVQGNAETGQQLIDRFLDNVPNLRRIRSQVQEAGEQGKIKGLDGRLLMVRSPHASLNLLIQGAGAIICKVWLVCLMKKIYRCGVDAKLVASIHDEYQFEVRKNDAAEFGKLTNEAIKEAQDILQLNCPLDSEFKVGETWAQTH
ncbi:MAG: hypothetical protein CMI54_08365 [Parcubacteria group bacterium]|jgi:DNA polymerase I-like protein with 3'-5' exonuclease and polymerase domains|nr:hypothetical protein [Parcubacteria group bacterium]|tara:strand:- start:5613 stop:7271 length:1659 start_codon:yes stop_codon:yes gene_type:complete